MNKSKRLKLLLERGYFPEELPPPFVTRSLAKYRESIFKDWSKNGNDPPKTTYEPYSFPRIGRRRRKLALVNPISQIYLTRYISENWVEIKKFITSSSASLNTPLIEENSDRAIPKPDFGLISLKRVSTGAFYDHILVSDISRFYGTIYTHVLPWAMKGKKWCKANLNKSILKNTVGNQLDVLVRKGQDNQTLGIPIGPDTSRILSEIVAIGIEKHFQSSTDLSENQIFRYVDDFFIGYDGAGEAENAVAHLSSACAHFELELNHEKTEVLDATQPSEELWPSELREPKVRPNTKAQANDIIKFFNMALHYANERPADNVLVYALKVARSFSIDTPNFPLFEDYVLKCARASSLTLPIAVEILINHKELGSPVNADKARKLIEDTIRKASLIENHGEISWSLFLAKGLEIQLTKSTMEPVSALESSVCALISLDLEQMGLLRDPLDKSIWQSSMHKNALTSPMWLLAYEADVKGWLSSPESHVDNDPFFGPLKRRGVYFYDTRMSVRSFADSTQQTLRDAKRHQRLAKVYNLVSATSSRPYY